MATRKGWRHTIPWAGETRYIKEVESSLLDNAAIANELRRDWTRWVYIALLPLLTSRYYPGKERSFWETGTDQVSNARDALLVFFQRNVDLHGFHMHASQSSQDSDGCTWAKLCEWVSRWHAFSLHILNQLHIYSQKFIKVRRWGRLLYGAVSQFGHQIYHQSSVKYLQGVLHTSSWPSLGYNLYILILTWTSAMQDSAQRGPSRNFQYCK